ncbi:MAG: hypothetical protein L6R37_006760 [Teloschistes peruensis]|nr:MAG: hypothetical protein L6R37_006760 [Teloschistes peruensis]
MGWFWADSPLAPSAPHPIPKPNAAPPVKLSNTTLHPERKSLTLLQPGCPMHNAATQTPFPPRASNTTTKNPPPPSSCPVLTTPNEPSPPSTITSTTASKTPSYASKLNPLNYMPTTLSQSRSATQTLPLPTTRETSSIPRGDTPSQNWEYPSPQQMYNAMLRKGYTDTPEDAVESMVAVHNFLNEGAWREIVGWEERFSQGLVEGWRRCRRGEEAFLELQQNKNQQDRQPPQQDIPETATPRLLRFHGRPKDLTPKAAFHSLLSRLLPSKYSSDPPFDRHDWYVLRTTTTRTNTPHNTDTADTNPNTSITTTQERRYVIDYYSAPPEATGEPVFYLDVRPAVDGPVAGCERVVRWGGDIWWRASGGRAREVREV